MVAEDHAEQEADEREGRHPPAARPGAKRRHGQGDKPGERGEDADEKDGAEDGSAGREAADGADQHPGEPGLDDAGSDPRDPARAGVEERRQRQRRKQRDDEGGLDGVAACVPVVVGLRRAHDDSAFDGVGESADCREQRGETSEASWRVHVTLRGSMDVNARYERAVAPSSPPHLISPPPRG